MRHFVHLDKLRVCYSPSQIWNFVLNPISTVELQHFESRVQDDGQKAKFSLSHQYLSGPMSQPRKKIIIWQVLPQGVFTFCCSVLKTTTRYISASIQQTLPKPQAHALIQSKDGRFQSGTVLWFFLWQPCRHREKQIQGRWPQGNSCPQTLWIWAWGGRAFRLHANQNRFVN